VLAGHIDLWLETAEKEGRHILKQLKPGFPISNRGHRQVSMVKMTSKAPCLATLDGAMRNAKPPCYWRINTGFSAPQSLWGENAIKLGVSMTCS